MSVLVYSDASEGGAERSVTVGGDPIMVGRSPECGICSNDPRLSRRHARFYKGQDGNVYIEDLGSSNGVYVGQTKVQHSMVPVGEYVTIGGLMFRLMPPDAYAQPQPDPYA